MQPRENGILTESAPLPTKPKRIPLYVAAFLLSGLVVVAAVADVPGEPTLPFEPKTVVELLDAPGIEALPSDTDLPYVYNERILPGDTLQTIFQRLGVNDREALTQLNGLSEMRNVLRQLRAGRSLVAMVSTDGRLVSLNLPISRSADRFIVQRTGDGFSVSGGDLAQTETLVEMRSGTITHSLFGATDA